MLGHQRQYCINQLPRLSKPSHSAKAVSIAYFDFHIVRVGGMQSFPEGDGPAIDRLGLRYLPRSPEHIAQSTEKRGFGLPNCMRFREQIGAQFFGWNVRLAAIGKRHPRFYASPPHAPAALFEPEVGPVQGGVVQLQHQLAAGLAHALSVFHT